MTILHLCHFSGNLGDYIRIRKIHDYLQSRGNDIHLLNLVATRYSSKKVLCRPDVVKAIIVRKMHLDETEVIRERLRLKLAVEALRKRIDCLRPHLILCEGIFSALVAIHAVEDRIPVITDVHSIVSAEYEGDTLGKPLEGKAEYLRRSESDVFRHSIRIIVISELMKKYVTDTHNVNSAKIHVIPNGSEFRSQVAQYRQPLRVIYGGVFSYYENIDSYLDLAKANRRCEFYLAGDGPLKKHLLRRISNERIDMRYLGYLKYDDSIAEFTRMNMGVAPFVRTLNISMAYPIKVFDYLSCGLPVITPDFGEWAKVISKHKCGLVTKTSSGEEFDSCLGSVDRSKWEEMSSNGLRLIRDQFNWNLLLRELDKIVEAFN
jgi:glycosyltransferase involved in cell wall biosynthesis